MNTHNQPCNKEKRINRLETDNIQNKTDIKNIKEDVDCLNNEDKNIKEIVQGLKEAVSTLTERKHTQMDIRNRTTSTICITNYNNRITYKNIIKIIY